MTLTPRGVMGADRSSRRFEQKLEGPVGRVAFRLGILLVGAWGPAHRVVGELGQGRWGPWGEPVGWCAGRGSWVQPDKDGVARVVEPLSPPEDHACRLCSRPSPLASPNRLRSHGTDATAGSGRVAAASRPDSG